MIELKNDGNYVKITSPYDEDLKTSISDLDKSDRQWDGKSWKVIVSKVEWLREVAQECADRRGWKVRDYTNLNSDTEIKYQQKLDNEKEAKERVAQIIELLPLLPYRILKLVSWNNSTIRLQLTRLLDDKDLFNRLYHASPSAFKVQAVASFDPKQSFGFAFDIDNHPDVVRSLLNLEVQYLKKYNAVEVISGLPSGAVRLTSDEGIKLIGLEIDSVDLSELNHTSQSWELAVYNDKLYWVAETEKFVAAWLSEYSYRFMSVGGVIFHCIPKGAAGLIFIITQWELETWFYNWSRQLLTSEDFKHSGKGWEHWEWNHPADELIRHLKGFKGDRGVQRFIGADCEDLVNRIETRKQKFARMKKDDAKSKANELAAFKLRQEYDTKAKLLELAESRKVEVRKSWAIDKIIDALCKDTAYCLKLLGLE